MVAQNALTLLKRSNFFWQDNKKKTELACTESQEAQQEALEFSVIVTPFSSSYIFNVFEICLFFSVKVIVQAFLSKDTVYK